MLYSSTIKKSTQFILIISILILFSACSPSVRFTSKKNDISYGTPAQEQQQITQEKKQEKIQVKRKTKTLNKQENLIVKIAESWLGTPYKYGGNTRNGVDCSGLVKNIYEELGVSLPRTSREQYSVAIPINSPKIGDLVFFKKKGRIYHVGIYIGNDYMIHSSSSSGVIKQNIQEKYYAKNHAGFGRVAK
jgi:cell wall-associated NlpC family hydrolase